MELNISYSSGILGHDHLSSMPGRPRTPGLEPAGSRNGSGSGVSDRASTGWLQIQPTARISICYIGRRALEEVWKSRPRPSRTAEGPACDYERDQKTVHANRRAKSAVLRYYGATPQRFLNSEPPQLPGEKKPRRWVGSPAVQFAYGWRFHAIPRLALAKSARAIGMKIQKPS